LPRKSFKKKEIRKLGSFKTALIKTFYGCKKKHRVVDENKFRFDMFIILIEE
jgi:hypothetical protein